MKIAIVTDAWIPQVNGVVRTYQNTGRELEKAGHEVFFVTPEYFSTIPCPSYPSIQIAIRPAGKFVKLIEEFSPDVIHVATEGTLGHAARKWCLQQDIPFTTSFHTQFPEYIRMRVPLPVDWSYRYLRHFHDPAIRTLVPTESQRQRLQERGFRHVEIWGRGVNTELFRPGADLFGDLPGPVFLNMGRVAVEKNIETFLKMELPGSKVIVGDGPDLDMLRKKYPQVLFTGFKFGEELVQHIASADVFVFPSLTDTFGIVLLEAMACGVPVAAFPVTGPIDVIVPGVTGIMDDDLQQAALSALELSSEDCISYAREHSWAACTADFANYLAPPTNKVA